MSSWKEWLIHLWQAWDKKKEGINSHRSVKQYVQTWLLKRSLNGIKLPPLEMLSPSSCWETAGVWVWSQTSPLFPKQTLMDTCPSLLGGAHSRHLEGRYKASQSGMLLTFPQAPVCLEGGNLNSSRKKNFF